MKSPEKWTMGMIGQINSMCTVPARAMTRQEERTDRVPKTALKETYEAWSEIYHPSRFKKSRGTPHKWPNKGLLRP
jgi:hypothetical protein